MVAWLGACRRHCGDNVAWGRPIGIADAEVDEILSLRPERGFFLVDCSEQIGRQFLDSSTELDGHKVRCTPENANVKAMGDVCVRVLSGVDAGQVVELQRALHVGRGLDQDLILADGAVSRRHIKIFRSGETVRLIDLGSGNGTRVNGAQVTESDLQIGDRIEIGQTVLVLESEASSEPEPELVPFELLAEESVAPSPLPLPKRALVVLGTLAAVAFLLIVYRLLWPPSQPLVMGGAELAFRQGVHQFNQENFAQALQSFRKAAALDPAVATFVDYVHASERENVANGLYKSAQNAKDGGRIEEGLAALDKVDKQSLFFLRATNLKRALVLELVKAKLNEAQTSLVGDPDTAKEDVAQVLALDPQNSQAQALRSKLTAPPKVVPPKKKTRFKRKIRKR